VEYPWIRRRSPVLDALLANSYDIAHDYDVSDYVCAIESFRWSAPCGSRCTGLLDALLVILGDLGPEDRQAFFAGCASEVYGLQ
jgi:hypothetical protein